MSSYCSHCHLEHSNLERCHLESLAKGPNIMVFNIGRTGITEMEGCCKILLDRNVKIFLWDKFQKLKYRIEEIPSPFIWYYVIWYWQFVEQHFKCRSTLTSHKNMISCNQRIVGIKYVHEILVGQHTPFFKFFGVCFVRAVDIISETNSMYVNCLVLITSEWLKPVCIFLRRNHCIRISFLI